MEALQVWITDWMVLGHGPWFNIGGAFDFSWEILLYK